MKRILLQVALAILAWGATSSAGHAHGLDVFEARIEKSMPGTWRVKLELALDQIEMLSGVAPYSIRTGADLARVRAPLAAILSAGTILEQNQTRLSGLSLHIPSLEGGVPITPEMELPQRVAMFLEARGDDSIIPEIKNSRYRIGEFDIPVSFLVIETDLDPAPAEIAGALSSPALEAVSPPPATVRLLTDCFWIGFRHIIPEGTDHLLFILGVYLGSRRFKEILWQVTAFTVAHCVTLLFTMAGLVRFPEAVAHWVEIGIAASIAFVAVENLLPDAKRPFGRRLAIVTVFGLVHGLGFAGALSEVDWPRHLFLPAVFCANVGIEFAQLLIVITGLLLTAWFWKKAWYRKAVVMPASTVIALIALYWAVDRAMAKAPTGAAVVAAQSTPATLP
ncbi:HupE/UreJ family protein [Luteolibacter arcticus]|uniref:HupE/UreJ family protein n=1 Tax=Luteolibacter arcticus TaxID=1581411 RepID=A0ABT3GI21_9BACT|nr:HupE/UreJ family protein [Luteolibacter arcticus]MCW1923155.1 HupE/UreJ family protein [Luteolibacter arcticus]